MRQRAHVEILRTCSRGNFGEPERGVTIAQGTAESNCGLLSALQTPQMLIISTYAQLKHELIIL